MDYTQSIGNINELKCMAAMMQLGYDCSIPYGNSSKYDFIADIDGKLLRFQCKSSRYVSKNGIIDYGAFTFNTTSSTSNTKETKKHQYNSNQIDYFITCFQEKVYVIPVDECSIGKTLRLSPPKNNNKSWNNAEDYLLEKYFSESTHYLQSKESYLNRQGLFDPEMYEKYYCKQCGKEVSEKGNLCPECSAFNSRKAVRPTKEELKELIRVKSFIEIGRIFGVTDNSVRKWCDNYSLPRRVQDIQKINDEDWLNI